MQRIIAFIIPSIIALCQLCAQTFKTQAPSSVSTDETFRVQYVLSTTDGEGFSCSPNKDFTILGGPSTSTYSSTQWVNGKTTHQASITYTYILQANRVGNLPLPRPTVRVNGKTLQATAATINVTQGGGGGKQRSNPRTANDNEPREELRAARAVTQNDLYVRCIASKSSLYEQEPVVLTYKVFARAGVGLSNIQPHNKPEMQGFWTQEVELPTNLQPSYQTIGGSTYRVFTFMQYVAFPQQTGTITLPSLTTDCSVIQRDTSMDPLESFFNGGGNLSTQLQRSTGEVAINVKPLPAPKPAGFSGGVGSFNAEGHLLTSQPATNDVATYRITISGQGNMRLIQAPTITFPKSFDSYDAKTIDETRITFDGIAGKLNFDYTFVPREEGDFEIPATEFVYFDIQNGDYRTINIPATKLHIKKGLRSKEDVDRELALRQSNIRPDHTAASSNSSMGWTFYLILLALICIGTIVADRLLSMTLADMLRKKWNASAHKRNKHLTEAEKALAAGKAREFYTALEQALTSANTDSATTDEILSRRYAPDASEPSALQQTMEAARKILTTFILLLFPAFSVMAQTAAEESAPKVEEVQISISDSLYNAGNEAFRLKEYGQAVLCYSRALWHNPDNMDARYNLSITQTRLEDQFSVPQEMFFKTWIRELRATHSIASWLKWSLWFFFLIMVCGIVFHRVPRRIVQRIAFYLGIMCVVAFATTNIFAGMQHYDKQHCQIAVIMTDEAACYDSPIARTKASLTLHAGTLVTITDEYEKDWVEVELPDTRHFWMQKKHVERVKVER